jgi:hypothetical protein
MPIPRTMPAPDTEVGVIAGARVGDVARRMVSLVSILCALTGFAAVPVDSKILFARDTTVPRPVQEFAWRVIETRCNYQRYEREQRSFWAYNAQATKVDGGVAYSIDILSDLPWKQTLPSALIEMTIVDDGRLRLTALKSSFVNCEFSPTPRN